MSASSNVLSWVAPPRASLALLVRLRWIAIGGQLFTIAVAGSLFGVRLPVAALLAGIAALAVVNLLTVWYVREGGETTDRLFLAEVLVDVAVLTYLLFLTGGAANPFAEMYLLPLSVSAAVLPLAYSAILAAVTVACYGLISLYHLPLAHGLEPASYASVVATARWVNYALIAGLAAYFVVGVTEGLRRFHRLATLLRARELNNACLVNLGSLAGDAAHRLGSPLSVISLLARELQDECGDRPQAKAHLETIASNVARCRVELANLSSIVGDIERPCRHSPADYVLGKIINRFRTLKPGTNVDFAWDGNDAPPYIACDATVQQALVSLLEECSESSPREVRLAAGSTDDALTVRISGVDGGGNIDAHRRIREAFREAERGAYGSDERLLLASFTIHRLGGLLEFGQGGGADGFAQVTLPLRAISNDGEGAVS